MSVHHAVVRVEELIGRAVLGELVPAQLPLSPSLPYDLRDRESILRYGLRIKGKTAREVCAKLGMPDPSAGQPGWKATKNFFGDLLERYYRLDPAKHSESHPDFAEANLEMKLLPLKRGHGKLLVKEPTSISMIDYIHLKDETWRTATVRPKLLHILFVFQVMEREDPMASWYRDLRIFDANDLDQAIFETDWSGTHRMVLEGRAHELSETQAKVLAARRKGRGGAGEKRRPQPVTRFCPDAPSRAWALKTAFTRQFLEEKVLNHSFEDALPSLVEKLTTQGLSPMEDHARVLLASDEGRTLSEVASRAHIPLGGGKSLAASLVKRRLSVRTLSPDASEFEIREFEKLGITVKTLHLRSADGLPFEAVSFPAVNLQELADQSFDGEELEDGTVLRERCELIDQLTRILFVVTYSPEHDDKQEQRYLGKAFFWSPTPQQWKTIQGDWERIRDQVREGKAAYDKPCTERGRANQLTKGVILHMRPHGRVACDEDVDPKGQRVTKQSYWLNKSFVYQLVKENNALPPGAVPKEEAS